MKRETACVHHKLGKDKEHPYGALINPIYQTTTYTHPAVGESTGFNYTRESNPTRTELETVMSNLEHAYDSIACSSGMSAVYIAFELLPKGSHVICTKDLYGGSVRIFDKTFTRHDMSFTYVDTSDISSIERELTDKTKALYIETPSNPTMQVSDIRTICEFAKSKNLLVIVDNTFLSPYFQNPIVLGADIVIHSASKYLGGHNDTIAGFICLANEELSKKARYIYKTIGMGLAPFDSFLILRGIKTLALRMERQEANALKIADFLSKHPKIDKVFYVGLKDNIGYEINKKQARGFGAMISCHTKDVDTAVRVLENVEVFQYAESLGGVESLITYPMLQTHADLALEKREELGINDRFLRISVGIENIEDLIEDLSKALG